MNVTKDCELLTDFYLKNNCIKFVSFNNNTIKNLTNLYDDINESDKQLQTIKDRHGFYNLELTKIENVEDIPKPRTFAEGMTELVANHIDKHSYYLLTYTFHLLDFPELKRDLIIHFVIEKMDVDINLDLEPNLEIFNRYVDRIVTMYFILNKHSVSNNCSKDLTIFLYFTSLKKKLSNKVETLGYDHVNTGFTYTCPETNGEIVIFRKEEWFKVLIHESFHNLKLDFSNMDNSYCTQKMRLLFQVNSDVNLFESYTEFWAKTLNIVFVSYSLLGKRKRKRLLDTDILDADRLDTFLKYIEFLINYERQHCFFQMVKVLDSYGLTYQDILTKTEKVNAFSEKSNVFTYFVITNILFSEFMDVIEWCNLNNKDGTLLMFQHNEDNLKKYCLFIEKKYRSHQLTYNIGCSEKLFHKMAEKHKRKETKSVAFILNNLRLSLCEMK